MNSRINFLLAACAFALFLWWLWPGSAEQLEASDKLKDEGGQQLVSAIQPIETASATADVGVSEQLSSASSKLSLSANLPIDTNEARDVEQRFAKAVEAMDNGEQQIAIGVLSDLIQEHPKFAEPYVNLASLYAANGQLPAARQTLVKGLNANESYAALFGNLQKVHGALAGDAISKVELPVFDQISISPAQEEDGEQLKEYQQRLAQAEEDYNKANNGLQKATKDLTESEQQLALLNTELLDTKKQLELSLATASSNAETSSELQDRETQLQQELDVAKQQIRDMQAQHQQEITALRTSLQEQTEAQALLAQQQANQQKAEQQRLARESALREQEALARQQSLDVEAQLQEEQNRQVTDRVKSWANAWSSQSVINYVNHYADGYTPPGSNIDHSTWLEQRQIRLTNKTFIKVAVDNFEITRSGDQIAVVFTQHYQSNTMDDTIRKQLLFAVDENDWSEAKIVGERVIR